MTLKELIDEIQQITQEIADGGGELTTDTPIYVGLGVTCVNGIMLRGVKYDFGAGVLMLETHLPVDTDTRN